MIKKQFSASARRARNIIWNAAGRYDFEPPFMAFFPNGAPDHYFNMVVGLADKWLDMPRLWDFFESYAHDRRAEEFDEFLWLGIENCLFEKELPERPILAQLRARRAERFFETFYDLTRQQMEYQSMPVLVQQEIRWSEVLGKRAPLRTPRERRMAEALRFSGALDTDGLTEKMEAFLREFFRYEPGKAPSTPKIGTLARALFRHERRQRDRLLVRAGTGEGDHERAVQLGHNGLGRHAVPDEEDEAYVRALFGKCLLTEREMRILENDLCVGEDADCRLYVSAGAGCADENVSRDAADTAKAAAGQQKRNEAYLTENAARIAAAVRRLSAQIDTIFASYLRRDPEPARAGRIRSEAAYRLPLLGDDRVFLRDGEEVEPELCVDLLLDASQSRMHSQEILAAEATVIAKSMERAHIPTRVFAFRSLRSHTILERLKNFDERSCEGLTRYFAGGWNRDALAIRALGHLNDEPIMRGKQRILLILTDASPNDSAPLSGSSFFSREYEGAAAVKAAERAVRDLRKEGILVGAVFQGPTLHVENLQQIYGHSYVRIHKSGAFAQGVSDLLLMLLREAQTD